MSDIRDKNWRITRTGTLAAVTLSVSYLYLLLSQASFNYALLLAMASGSLYAVSSKIPEIKKYSTVLTPLSGFISMSSTTLLAGAIALLVTDATGILSTAFKGQNILSMIKTAVLAVIGFAGTLTGSYLLTQGLILLPTDRIDEKTSLGPRKSDFLFSVIITAITLFSISGTAILKDIPVSQLVSDLQNFLVSSEAFSGVLTSLIIVLSYIALRKAWRELPIKESVPKKHLENYKKITEIEKVTGWALVPLLVFSLVLRDIADISELGFLKTVETPGVRQVMVSVFLISLLIILFVRAVQFLTGDRSGLKSMGPYIVFGSAVWILSPVLIPLLDRMIVLIPEVFVSQAESFIKDLGGRNAVLAVLAAASWLSFALKSLTGTFRALGLVPSGVEGTSLTSSGLFLTSVGFFIYQPVPSSTMLFIGVALSIVIWEIGKRSTVLGREVGRKAESRQAEIVQIVSKLVVAAVAVIIVRTVLIFVKRSQITINEFTGLVFILSALGVTFLIFSLKDYT